MVSLVLLAVAAVAELTPPTAYDYKQVQIAAKGNVVAATFVLQNKVMFAESKDSGRTWSTPRAVVEPASILAGRHRGPRISLAGGAVVISAIVDGDLIAYRSTDNGASWKMSSRFNSVANSAREGLHNMAAGPDGLVYAVWLDLRAKATRIYGTASTDGGVTWQPDREIYKSPDGPTCQCCHPSVAIGNDGAIAVMWRNDIEGSRDLYLAVSHDRGKTFSAAEKLGAQSWKFDACPMDGGGLAFDAQGKPLTVWRREDTIFAARPGELEHEIHLGKDPAVAIGGTGTYIAWRDTNGIEIREPGRPEPVMLDPEGQYVELLSLADGNVLAAWERKGTIRFERVR